MSGNEVISTKRVSTKMIYDEANGNHEYPCTVHVICESDDKNSVLTMLQHDTAIRIDNTLQ